MPLTHRSLAACALLALALVPMGCAKRTSASKVGQYPGVGNSAALGQTATGLGFPGSATKNTTRVAGTDPTADAAAIARAVFPAGTPGGRPKAITLVDVNDWRSALAASVLMSAPVRAPVLFSDGTDLPGATADALTALGPTGSEKAGGAQVVRVGEVARPDGLKSTDLVGADPAALARAIDAFQASARGTTSGNVLVVSADRPEFAMPAAAWAAKSGDPILFVSKDTVPEATRVALSAHQRPRIYVLGPSTVISPAVTRVLRKLGTVIRVGGPDPQANAIAFAQYADSSFGWGVVDPGHGLVFADPRRPADAAAASPLSASGTWGPLLLTGEDGGLPKALGNYLLDIQPGYRRDPTRGVYNHGWIVGDESAISIAAQAQIDAALEISRTHNSAPSKP